MRRLLKHIDGNDVLAATGLVMLGAGLWWIYPPAALIVVGALLVRVAIWGRS